MNSPSSSLIDDDDFEQELFAYENITNADEELANLNTNFSPDEYLFSLEQNEGITDLFDVINM